MFCALWKIVDVPWAQGFGRLGQEETPSRALSWPNLCLFISKIHNKQSIKFTHWGLQESHDILFQPWVFHVFSNTKFVQSENSNKTARPKPKPSCAPAKLPPSAPAAGSGPGAASGRPPKNPRTTSWATNKWPGKSSPKRWEKPRWKYFFWIYRFSKKKRIDLPFLLE